MADFCNLSIQLNRANGAEVRCIKDNSVNIILPDAASLSINSINSVEIGETLTLESAILPVDAIQDVVWTVEGGGNSIARITGNTLTAVAPGVVTIVATSSTGFVQRQQFTVRLPATARLAAVATGVVDQVKIAWDAVAGATGYSLFQSTQNLSAFAGGSADAMAGNSAITKIDLVDNSTSIILPNDNVHYFLVIATNAAGNESRTNAEQTSAKRLRFTFATIGGAGNTVWMDRNLRALRVARSVDDTQAFGGLWQWGRANGRHNLKGQFFQSTTDQYNIIHIPDSGFVTGHGDWTTEDADGSQRQAIWNRLDGSSVCPTGFRVPSLAELETQRNSWATNDAAGAFASSLKFPIAGIRSSDDAEISSSESGYWSSEPEINRRNARYLYLNGNIADASIAANRAEGHSVRCIRDSSVSFISVPVAHVALESFQISSPNNLLNKSSINLTGSFVPERASNQNITWSIEGGNNAIASINGNRLTGISMGVVTVNASVDGTAFTDSYEVRVNQLLITALEITSRSSHTTVGSYQLTVKITPPNADNLNVMWRIQAGQSSVLNLQTVGNNVFARSNGDNGVTTIEVVSTDGSNIVASQVVTVGTGQQASQRQVPAPAELAAVATGAPNQIQVSWGKVTNADNYKLYSTTDNLSAFAGGTAANLASANPAASAQETAETEQILTLPSTATVYFLVTAIDRTAQPIY
ncbi:MAG: hypothetical protein HAW58_06405 [Candidatus Thioglobus sp.]|nr:hypothetical protein [Candidatus Thioglobus sp.]